MIYEEIFASTINEYVYFQVDLLQFVHFFQNPILNEKDKLLHVYLLCSFLLIYTVY